MWLSLDLFWRITEKASQCKFHILRFVSAMHFQSYGLNVSVIEERHLNQKKKTGTDFFFKKGEERRKNPKCNKVKEEVIWKWRKYKNGERRQGEGEIRLGDKQSS